MVAKLRKTFETTKCSKKKRVFLGVSAVTTPLRKKVAKVAKVAHEFLRMAEEKEGEELISRMVL